MAGAGGLGMPTPFGTIYTSNLTPDADTGIGKWSEEAFRRSMVEGVDREGRHLYPAFPYDHYTKVSDEDIHALYAFVMSRDPVRNTIPANEVIFPLNYRPLLAGWKLLFLDKSKLEPDASKSAEWNRGRYLVEGLGHCGSCPTPRNALGGEEKSRAYAGGFVDGWDAPPLNALTVGAHRWTVDQLVEYLSTGWQQFHSGAGGRMGAPDVTTNLAQVSNKEEIHAMAVYIASLSGQSGDQDAPPPVLVDAGTLPMHGPRSSRSTTAPVRSATTIAIRWASKGLQLSLSTAVRQPDATNTIQAILNGIHAGDS